MTYGNLEANRDNLIAIKDVFDKHNITFWLLKGTFLGLYRGGDIIEYDNDIDLALGKEDWGLYETCEKEFTELGFQVILTSSGCKALKRNDAGVDFFFFKKEGGGRVYSHMAMPETAFDEYNFIRWRDRDFRIFSDPERWLKYIYGEDWRTPIKDKHASNQVYGAEFEK